MAISTERLTINEGLGDGIDRLVAVQTTDAVKLGSTSHSQSKITNLQKLAYNCRTRNFDEYDMVQSYAVE
jgi:hypothetical protein